MLTLILQVFSQLWYDSLISFQVNKRCCNTLIACSACSTNSVDIVNEGCWRLEVNNLSYLLNIDTTRCYICAH
jgi:hypothetical protein